MTLPVRVGDDWPRLLVPASGCALPAALVERRERVLHVSRRNQWQRQDALTRAFARIATVYRIVDMGATPPHALEEQLIREASDIAPTLVWMQLQSDPISVTPATIRDLRRVCAKNAVLINWDGDQHYEPTDWQRAWFVDIGRELDCSLVKNTKHPAEYAARGVQHPGYLGQGVDCDALRPRVAPSEVGIDPPRDLVFVAHQHGAIADYGHRISVAARLHDTYPGRVGIYGGGWGTRGLPSITEPQQAAVYGAARGALSVSIRCDLPRYTSNRLLNILAAGGVGLVERFPDCAGLGLTDGVNCLLWSTWEELCACVDHVLAAPPAELTAIRCNARTLGEQHSWTAYMAQLLAMVDAIRAERAAALLGATA